MAITNNSLIRLPSWNHSPKGLALHSIAWPRVIALNSTSTFHNNLKIYNLVCPCINEINHTPGCIPSVRPTAIQSDDRSGEHRFTPCVATFSRHWCQNWWNLSLSFVKHVKTRRVYVIPQHAFTDRLVVESSNKNWEGKLFGIEILLAHPMRQCSNLLQVPDLSLRRHCCNICDVNPVIPAFWKCQIYREPWMLNRASCRHRYHELQDLSNNVIEAKLRNSSLKWLSSIWSFRETMHENALLTHFY